MTQPMFDKQEQLQQIQSGLMEGESIIAVTTPSVPARASSD